MVRTEKVDLPRFGREDVMPRIRVEEYHGRLAAAVERMKRERFDFLLVYADREHFANMAWLTGFDPRFEEALLLLDSAGRRALLVGNECMGYLPDPALGCEPVLFQEFSLMGQPRDGSAPLRRILGDFGIGPGAAVGCAGWKYYESSLLDDAPHALEVPAFLADILRDLAGDARNVRNANAIFMHPEDGLRTLNSADQIAQFEYASIRTSEGVLEVLRRIRDGVAERDLERWLDSAGLPRSCHPMICFGPNARRGLSSPGDYRARLGDPYTVGFGLAGALTCRAGVVARAPQDLPPETRDFYPRFAANYFDVVAAWYQAVRIGVTGGEVVDAVEARRDRSLYRFAVNPGHTIHLDEWVHSPFVPGGRARLRSGMALQMDIIPVSAGPFCYVNAEDGVALADETLRSEIASRHPRCWQRVQARRRFMAEALGVPLDDSVLPLSNMPGWLPPFVLSPDEAFVAR